MRVESVLAKVAEREDSRERGRDERSDARLQALLASTLPLGGAIGSEVLSGIPLSRGQSELYGRLAESARAGGVDVRPYPKRPLWKKVLTTRFAPGAAIQMPQMEIPPEAADILMPGLPEDVPLGELVGKKIVWSAKTPGVLAHELGHLEQKPRSLLKHLLLQSGGLAGPAVGLIGGAAAKTPEAAQQAGMIGAGLSALTSAPTLARELGASWRGVRKLREAGATRGQVLGAVAGQMAPAFMASALRHAMPALLAYYGAKLLGPRRKKDEEQSKEGSAGRKKDNTILRRALMGVLLGGSAAALASPFTYLMLRGRSMPRRAAALQSLLRIGERSTYAIPAAIAGRLAVGDVGRERKKKK